MNPAVPTWAGVAASLALVALAVAVACRQRLRLGREITIAAARAGAQLAAVGAILLLVFQHAGLVGAAGWLAVMVLIAGQVAARRARGLPRALPVATAAIAAGTAATVGALLALGVISPQPRVVIPVGGMVVSGAMAAAAVTLTRLREEAAAARPAIEARLSLGLPATQAFAPHLHAALRTALIPAIDSTKTVGLISLPGAMTGLILAGVSPLTAIRYQIVVMYMLLAAAALAALTAARLAGHALFDDAHRLRPLPPPRPARLRRGEPTARGRFPFRFF
jgi:putative ABC transport system permease protein